MEHFSRYWPFCAGNSPVTVAKDPMSNKSALVHVMVWRQTGDTISITRTNADPVHRPNMWHKGVKTEWLLLMAKGLLGVRTSATTMTKANRQRNTRRNEQGPRLSNMNTGMDK